MVHRLLIWLMMVGYIHLTQGMTKENHFLVRKMSKSLITSGLSNFENLTLKQLKTVYVIENSCLVAVQHPKVYVNFEEVDANGNTALHFAAKNKRAEVTEFLINMDIDINKENNEGKTSLMIAVEEKNIDIIRLLLLNGAHEELLFNSKLLNKFAHFFIPQDIIETREKLIKMYGTADERKQKTMQTLSKITTIPIDIEKLIITYCHFREYFTLDQLSDIDPNNTDDQSCSCAIC